MHMEFRLHVLHELMLNMTIIFYEHVLVDESLKDASVVTTS